MSGRHKFSELEAALPPARRARIQRLAKKLEQEVDESQQFAAPQPGAAIRSAHRDTYCYRLIQHGEVVYFGVTVDLRRRMAEHRARWPGATVELVGPPVTREAALEWRSRASRVQS